MKCLTGEQLQEMLSAAPDLDLLEHVSTCGACAARLAEQALALPMLEPPAGLQNEVLRKAMAQPTESLGSYALRVFAAMAAVLVLLFSGVFEKLARLPEDLPKLKEQIATIFIKEEPLDASESQ